LQQLKSRAAQLKSVLMLRFRARGRLAVMPAERGPIGSAGGAPRMRQTWRAPQGWVMLTNPSEDPTQVSVRYLSRTAPGLADELAWNPADPRPDR
jgi:hypothetical protein